MTWLVSSILSGKGGGLFSRRASCARRTIAWSKAFRNLNLREGLSTRDHWRRETLDDSNSLYKYLLRSVYNRSLNYLDKNRRAGEYGAYYRERIAALGSSYYAPDNSPVVQKLYNDDLRASLDAAIESLPPKCREVFRLSYIEDLSNREIGEQLGISPRTVENHMYAALKQLRRKLSKEQLLLLLSLLFMRGV